MNNTVQLLKALSDENRLRISMMLKVRPMCVCEINEILHIALSTISAHLKTLKYAGVITDRKEGRWIIYQLNKNNPHAINLIDFLYNDLQENEIFKEDNVKVKLINKDNIKTLKL